MDFILLSFFFIYYYFIVIVVFLTSYALYYADRRCFSIFARWDESLVGQTATLEVMINIRMQLSLMLHRVYLEVLRKVSYMRPVHNVCTGTQVLHWNLSEVFLDNRQPLPMLAQEGPAVINVSAGPDLGLLVWESCWRRSVVCTGAASHFWRLGYKTRRALTSRKIFKCTPYWRGTKSSIWPPSLGYIGYATMEAT